MKHRTKAQLACAVYKAPLAPGMCGREPPLPPKPKVVEAEAPKSTRLSDYEQRLMDAFYTIATCGGVLPLAPELYKMLGIHSGTFYNMRGKLRDLDLIDFRSGHGSNAHGPAPWMVRIVATGVVLRSANCPVTWTIEGAG